MNKKLKKLIAFFMALIISLPFIPAIDVFANLQNHVQNVQIQNIADPGYRISLKWKVPPPSQEKDLNALNGNEIHDDPSLPPTPPNPGDPYNRIMYSIKMRNASKGEVNYVQVDNGLITGPADFKELNLVNVDLGSLYSLKVFPYHMHTYKNPVQNMPNIDKEAPYSGAYPQEEVLYATDIVVNAYGRGSSLTVTWDNPTYDGKNIFKGYRIFYESGGALVEGDSFGHYKDVYIQDATPVTDPNRPSIKRLEYTISDSSILPGSIYAVKVEPFTLNGEDLIRNRPQIQQKIELPSKSLLIAFSDREYRDNKASVSLPLDVVEDGMDNVRLIWNALSPTLGNIKEVQIWTGNTDNTEDSSWRQIATLYSPWAVKVTNWPLEKPKTITYYQIKILVEDSENPTKSTTVDSEIAKYDPTEAIVMPNRPTIFDKKTIKTNNGLNLEVSWDAFIRKAQNAAEEALMENGVFVDKKVTYDVYLTDNVTNLEDPLLPKILNNVKPEELLPTVNPKTNTLGYKHIFTEYAQKNPLGDYSMSSISSNKLYFVKIVVHKEFSKKGPDGKPLIYTSAPEIAVIFINIDGEISTPPMVSKPPLRIKEDDKGFKVVTDKSIDIEWTQSWYEVYDITQDKWFAKNAVVKVASGGALVFVDDDQIAPEDTVINFYNALDINDVKARFVNAKVDTENFQGITGNKIQIRKVDLGKDADYQIKVIPYSELANFANYKEYLENLLAQEPGEGWVDIAVEKGAIMDYSIGNDPPQIKLEPNTTYVILFRAYRTMPDGRKVGYPTYIIGTTLPPEKEIDIEPTIPKLYPVSQTDVSITVKWVQQPPFKYVLYYSEIALDDPTKGTKVSIEEIEEKSTYKEEDGFTYRYYTIDHLFPNTGYYVWLQVAKDTEEGVKLYGISNPVFMKTDDLIKPLPPYGLGLAGSENLKKVNDANKTNLVASGKDYLVLEWLRDTKDKANPEGEVEFTAVGDVVSLFAPDMMGTYLAKFGSLISNKQYYVRGKTIVTITKGESAETPLEKIYSYAIQISLDSKFKDYLEIVIPPLEEVPQNTRYFIRKESDWTDVIIFRTNTSSDDYDSDVDPDLVPLPDKDFEIIYDRTTDTLTYRFRSNQKDTSGNKDNQVDQRFITKIIQSKVFVYEVDLSRYNNKLVRNRVMEIPYSIISTFTERKIDLKVKAENITVTLAPGSVETAEVKALKDYGTSAKLLVKLEATPDKIPLLEAEYGQTIEEYLSEPQKLTVQVIAPSKTITLNNLAKPAQVDLRLANRHTVLDKNVGAYMNNPNTLGWERIPANYDSLKAQMSFNTNKVNTSYSAIARNAPMVLLDDTSKDAVLNVTSKINITDLKYYNPNEDVNALQFNNLVAAVAKNKLTTQMNGNLSDEDFSSLGKAKILISGTNVSREAAMSSLVRLYEVKSKASVKDYTGLNETYYGDISGANAAYQVAMLKAADLGFYGNASKAEPKRNIKLGELLYILDIIIADSK